MDQITLILLIVAVALAVLDVFIPSGGLLTGGAIALVIERILESAGVVATVRWPLAALGMFLTMGLVIRFGERISELLFPAKIQTNLDRIIGLEVRVHRLREHGIIIELEGDLWRAQLAEGASALMVGDTARVIAFENQTPIIRGTEEGRHGDPT